MELGLRLSENDFILVYIIFIICLCLFFINLFVCYFILFTSRHNPVYGTIVAFAGSVLLGVCTDSECPSIYIIVLETINLLSMQCQSNTLKSNKLLPFDLSFCYFINKLKMPMDLFHDLIYPVDIS